MKRTTSEWSVRMLVDMRERINPDAEYQRGLVWSEAQQRLLIDSLLRGYDMPKLYFRKLPEGGRYLYEVVDGKQRLTAMWLYLSDEFRLPMGAEFEGLGKLGSKSWSELPEPARDRLQFAKVTISEIDEATEDEVAELFLRLQKGEPLRAAEKRNAVRGPVRTFINVKLATHPVFPHLGIPNRRFTWHELAAITLKLIIAGGPATVKGADLGDLYEDQTFDPDGQWANDAIVTLDDLEKVARIAPGMISTRWAYVDLSLSLRRLRATGTPWEPSDVAGFFQEFELERKDAATRLADFREEIADLDMTTPVASGDRSLLEIAPDMFAYVQAFSREGATEENIRIRFEVMSRRLQALLDR